MIFKKSWKIKLARILDRTSLLMLGAWIMSLYVDLVYAKQLGDALHRIGPGLILAYFLTSTVASRLRYGSRPNPNYKDISPRWAGSLAVLLTGGFAAVSAGWSDMEGRFIWASLIALFTLISAAVVWRFATDHLGEIGEARFITSAKSEQL